MAMLLKERDSTDKHLNAGRRHSRLCQEVPGCDQFLSTISPSLANLEAKAAVTASKIIERENTLDTLNLRERLCDKKIRTLFERCAQYDRDNIGANVMQHLFPEERLTPYVTGERKKKTDLMDQIVKRSETLAADHPLQAIVAELKTAIVSIREQMTKYADSQLAVKLATADESVAQAAVRKMYEANYLDARKLYGKEIAESIFPELKTARETDSSATQTTAAASAATTATAAQ